MKSYMVTKRGCVWNKTFLLNFAVWKNNVAYHPPHPLQKLVMIAIEKDQDAQNARMFGIVM